MMKRCSSAARYRGIRKPKCNGGRGCEACLQKYRQQGASFADTFAPLRQPLRRIRSARKRAADLRRVRQEQAEFRADLRERADLEKAVRRILDGGLIRPTYMHPVLGAPYTFGLPGATFTLDPNYRRGGLWNYARRMQADDLVADQLKPMSKAEAAEAVKKFRLSFPKLVKGPDARPICAACKKPIDGSYASVGGNIEPFLAPKYYHVEHVPTVKFDPYAEFAQRFGIDG